MFSLLAVLAIVLSFGAIPILMASVFLKTSSDDLACQRELLATTGRGRKEPEFMPRASSDAGLRTLGAPRQSTAAR